MLKIIFFNWFYADKAILSQQTNSEINHSVVIIHIMHSGNILVANLINNINK